MSEFEKVSSTSSDSYSENTPGGKTVDEYRQDEEQELAGLLKDAGDPNWKQDSAAAIASADDETVIEIGKDMDAENKS